MSFVVSFSRLAHFRPTSAMETRPAKRRRRQAECAARPSTLPCLLPLLQPVRHCLHPFLSGSDATRLMQASGSITACLLADYAFVDHVFTYRTATAARCSFALFARYHMRILRLCLPRKWNEPLIDHTTGQSVLPASLVALTMGDEGNLESGQSVAYAAFDGSNRQLEAENAEEGKAEAEEEESEFHRLIRPVDIENSYGWLRWGGILGGNLLIPLGALPRSLRFLQFSDPFNQPLQPGSIPDSVEALQFGHFFSHPFGACDLPASLTHLVLGSSYNQPLLPGVLPVGLLRLHLGGSYNHPILVGSLPPQLQQLSLSYSYNQPLLPGAIPPSVTHLRLGHFFNQPLQAGSIPEGVTHLNLGNAFSHPLLPGVLPTSLRELFVSPSYNHPFLPGSLPDGLKVLVFEYWSSFQHTLQPGVIPASVIVVSMGRFYEAKLVAGGIPSTVRWLLLPSSYAESDVSSVLSPSTRVVT